MSKNVFVDENEQSDVVEDRKNFFKKMEEFKPYRVEFKEDCIMKPKVYLSDCEVGGNNRRPNIIITYDEFTFSANDGVRRALTQKKDTFLQSKGRGQGIGTSEFFLPYGQLNLASLTTEKREKVVHQNRIQEIEAVEIFEYRKNNNCY